MRLVSIGSDEPGVFALGQVATGVIAVGQIATGFVAIGQVARGVIALGQVTVGIVAVGQLSAGAAYGIGMLGIAGRGRGFVLRLAPKVERIPPRPAPPPVPVDRLLAGVTTEDWIEVERRGEELFAVVRGGAPIPIDTTSVYGSMREAIGLGETVGVARVVGSSDAATEGDYRTAPERSVTLSAKQIALNRPRGYRLVGWFGEKNIGAVELVLRAILTLAWAAIVCGVLAWSLAPIFD